jgi:hypothetical protein
MKDDRFETYIRTLPQNMIPDTESEMLKMYHAWLDGSTAEATRVTDLLMAEWRERAWI